LRGSGQIALTPTTIDLSERGRALAQGFGIDVAGLARRKSPLCRECLDWSERRSHLAGSLGRAYLARFGDLGWACRDPASRAVLFSNAGHRQFNQLFELTE